VSKQKKKDG